MGTNIHLRKTNCDLQCNLTELERSYCIKASSMHFEKVVANG